MGDRRAKEALFAGFADVAKALGHGRRAELIDVLMQGERHVEQLATEIDQSVANTSHHLRQLAAAGLVDTRRQGTRIYYRLASEEVGRLWCAIRTVAQSHLDDIDRLTAAYLGDRGDLTVVRRDELLERVEAGAVVLVDVRPRSEYEAGHIAGAVSVPLAEVQSSLSGIPHGVDVVAYCRGRYCVLADDAVHALEADGRRAARLEDGFPEWRDAGLPVAVGSTR